MIFTAKMIKAFAFFSFILLYIPTNAQDFTLNQNGVTVECGPAAVGDIGTINGITYTKRDQDGISLLVEAEDWPALETTCTSGISNMSSMFQDAASFNGNISSWDVSSVTTTNKMFNGATTFNGDLSAWNVSSVTQMNGMFFKASSFNGDVSSWDVSSVTSMTNMFREISKFKQDLSTWCVARIGSKPSYFGNVKGTNPLWGTCPSREIYGDAGWRLLSLPITNGTVSDISDNTAIQGIPNGDNPNASANFYLYDDSGTWEVPTDISTVIGDGKGFAVYFYNNTVTRGFGRIYKKLDAQIFIYSLFLYNCFYGYSIFIPTIPTIFLFTTTL